MASSSSSSSWTSSPSSSFLSPNPANISLLPLLHICNPPSKLHFSCRSPPHRSPPCCSVMTIGRSSSVACSSSRLDTHVCMSVFSSTCSSTRPASFTVSSASGSDQSVPSKGDEDGEGSIVCYDRVIPRSPSPEIDPKDVVYAQLRALQERDLATVFEFASPKNKSYVGPLSRFTEMIEGRAYNIMLGHATAKVLSTLYVTHERFQQRVLIKGGNGKQTTFSWSLSKQGADPYRGCWMTDSVHRDE